MPPDLPHIQTLVQRHTHVCAHTKLKEVQKMEIYIFIMILESPTSGVHTAMSQSRFLFLLKNTSLLEPVLFPLHLLMGTWVACSFKQL